MEYDVEKICRVCLQGNLENCKLLFEEPKEASGISISDMISELTIYKLRRYDELPHLICFDCIERIESAYSFKKDFEESQLKLIAYLVSINKSPNVADMKHIATTDIATQTIDSTLYPCEKCDKKFIKYERLREHRLIAHKGTANTCRICEKSFKRLTALKSHISQAHKEAGYHTTAPDCYICKKSFARRDHVVRHLKNVHKIMPTAIYGDREPSEIEFKHTESVSENQETRRDGAVTDQDTRLDDDLTITQKSIPERTNQQTSNTCVKNTPNGSGEQFKHPHECLLCNKFFSSKSHQRRHMRNVHKLDPAHVQNPEQIKVDNINTVVSDTEIYPKAEMYGWLTNEGDDSQLSNNYENEGYYDNADTSESNEQYANGAEFVAANHFFKEEIEIHEPVLEITEPEALCEKKITIKLEKLDNSHQKDLCDIPPPETPQEAKDFKVYKKLSIGKFGCILCDKSFTTSYHVKRHFLSHTQEKKFECNVCDMRFSRADHLKNHMTRHDPVKPFGCDTCNATYGRSDHLKRHKELHHSDGAKNFGLKTEACEICNKSYTTKAYLQKHMRKHTENAWKCKECSLEFVSTDDLKSHIKTHIKHKPFLCSECGLVFPRKNYLIVHMRRHTGERPYKCQYCDKGFPRTTDLRAHEKCHTGEKTHFCNICGKGFPRPYKLSVHMRIHTGEKPYRCTHCPKAFAQCNDMKAHIRRHTGERYRCEICGIGFIQRYSLTQHKVDVHGIVVETRHGRINKATANEANDSFKEISSVMDDPSNELQTCETQTPVL